jgi:hypothetical protein
MRSEDRLRGYATLLRQQATPSAVEAISRDCSTEEQAELDVLLIRIEQLTRTELLTLDALFDRCAYITPQEQAFVVLLLRESYEQYRQVAEMKDASRVEFGAPATLLAWQNLVETEETRSALMTELFNVQDRIIALLLTQSPVVGDEVDGLRNQAIELTQQIVTARSELDELRNQLSVP